ncbi:murein L,D-transpeptidase catalytic domain family protein [Puia sp. P3]|uniref:murein L,D-transpeptidase catalytic domain family protein n=1 Tax=Puia sp. P3 TaxID=3423952 RepID=UPI003D66DC4A
MRRILTRGLLCVLVAFVLPVNVLKAGNPVTTKTSRASRAAAFAEEVTTLYDQLDLKEVGLTKKAFEYALKGYNYLLEHHWLSKTNILSICDLSQSSRNKRLYVVDLEQRKVLVNTYVAHGHNSGMEYASSFSNNPSSHKTSLGFYVTQGTYFGNNGLSLKMRGMERGFNDKAGGRNIVVHGSEYVGPDFLQMNKFCGRSYGCPAVPADESENIIDLIKEGSCLFIYHPTKKYIARSKILNN